MGAAQHDLEALVHELTRARAAAERLADAQVVGVRAVEARPGVRHYMCAFADGRVGCLDADVRPVEHPDGAVEVLRAALLVEHAEEMIDPAELNVVATAARRVGTSSDDPTLRNVTDEFETAVHALISWRTDELRVVADIAQLDHAVTLHDRARRAHIGFVAATDPLVPVQDTLPEQLRDALRELEQASAQAGVAGGLTPVLAGALTGIDEGVAELLGRYWSPGSVEPA